MITNKIKKVAREAVLAAGVMSRREYQKFDRGTIKFKSHHEIITKVDLASEKIIVSQLQKNFPEHEILSEEMGFQKGKSDYLWIIDPIDGTTNFSMHNPLWSISLGLSYKGKIIFGMIYAPFLEELFDAELGKGAKLNGKKINTSRMKKEKVLHTFCHGSDEGSIQRAMRYYQHQKVNGFDCRQMGSAAMELAYVACGRVESIVIPGVHSWDVAAGILLVREAGGRVTDFSGKKWSLKSTDMVASNGLVHRDILKVLKNV